VDGGPAPDVLLISMPWHGYSMLSLQLGALKAYLSSRGIAVECRHYYKDVLAYMGLPLYNEIQDANVCELVSAALLFPDRRDRIEEAALDRIAELRSRPDSVFADFAPFNFGECTRLMEELVEDIVADVEWERLLLVGFSSTHVQFLSSLLLARRLKEDFPDIPIVFGGYLLRDDLATSLVELFPYVDYVIAGEGEVPLYELVRALRGEQPIACVPGLVHRDATGAVRANSEMRIVADLDELPIPDFSEYFTHGLRFMMTPQPRIQLEMSRGCYWGRCSFCVESMKPRSCYRRKSAEKVLEEIEYLSEACGSLNFMFTDADVSDKVDVFSAIAERDVDWTFTAELTGFIDKEGLSTLRRAGVTLVQIGVEALDDRLLRRFMKGVRFMRYVELIKWCYELDIGLYYNLILGAPFETQQDMEVTVARMPLLRWFQYPHVSTFAVSAGSKIFDDPQRFGISEIVPGSQATVCYPEDVARRIAPLVDFGDSSGYSFLPLNTVDHSSVLDALAKWKADYESDRPTLLCRRGRGFLDIGIFEDKAEYHVLLRDELEQQLYLHCVDSAKSVADLRQAFPDEDDASLQRILERFERDGLMISDGKQHLGLASLAT
jgi:ribosomal peptide maturation radical SAM protein 1